MSYEPTNWKSGDVVTSAKLNKLEQGVADAGGGNVLVVHITDDEGLDGYVADKTFAEISAAVNAGKVVFAVYFDEIFPIAYFDNDEEHIAAIFKDYIIRPEENTLIYVTFTINSDNTLEMNNYESFQLTPYSG